MPKVGDTVTCIVHFPNDATIPGEEPATAKRVGKIAKVQDESVFVDYEPITTDEKQDGATQSLKTSELRADGPGRWTWPGRHASI